MEDKINDILNKYIIHPKDHLKIVEELLNLFPVIKCQCIHEINERFPSELLNKKCNDCGGVL